jgi:hypothetical protein
VRDPRLVKTKPPISIGASLMSIAQLQRQTPTNTERNLSRHAFIAIKALVSIGLIAFVAARLDYARVLSYWHALNGIWVAGALGILVLEICLLAGVRLKLMVASVDARRPLRTTARIALCGFFFEQVTIGFIGGDAIRLWLLRQTEVRHPSPAARSVVRVCQPSVFEPVWYTCASPRA